MKERPILFNGEMVRAILDGRKEYGRKLYNAGIIDRLVNGLVTADEGKCWEWTRAHNGQGYGTLTVCGKTQSAHRLAYFLAKGNIPEGMSVCHKCDNPPCINPDHLFLGTRSDNMADCYKKGRSNIKPNSMPGETNPSAKLSKAQVNDIRHYLSVGYTQAELSHFYGVSQSQISNISKGRQWK